MPEKPRTQPPVRTLRISEDDESWEIALRVAREHLDSGRTVAEFIDSLHEALYARAQRQKGA